MLNMKSLIQELKEDVRYIEGLTACMNCGVCTAICPAAEVYDYDPRIICDIVQSENLTLIEELLKKNTIWYCGECLSCKTRCPRGNAPGYIIQALRTLSQKRGYYIYSERGMQQLELKRILGNNMLKHGYCVYLDEIDTDYHPEQGPIWDWFKENRETLLKKIGANYRQEGSGTLRLVPEEDMNELRSIFKETGATEWFDNIEKLCNESKVDK